MKSILNIFAIFFSCMLGFISQTEAQEEQPQQPDPDAGKHAFQVLLDCVALDDGLVQYLTQVLRDRDWAGFYKLSQITTKMDLDPEEFLFWLGNKELWADDEERVCAAVMDACLERLRQEGRLELLAALLVLLWLLVKRCQEYNVPGKVARVFSVFLCAAMALGCFWAQQGLSALGSMTSGLLTGAEANKITKEPFVIYLSGVDTRGELTENARSDVNILAAVNPVTKRVALINTPRDYYVDLAGTDSKDKLTHAGLYGVETSMATLGNLYGVNVDHYIRINFAGFISIIDALGGVDVYSDQAFTSVGSPGYYDPTTFVEGWNHLDGKAALAFARERHAFASGDIQRGINQMKVIDAMLNKIKSPALLMGFSKIMDAAADCFVTSFSQDQISALVRMQLSDFAEWDIESYTVTGTSSSSTKCYSAKGQKLYVMKPDDASVSKAREMIASVLGGEGTVADTTQKPEKTEVFTPTTDPNAAVSEVPAESVPEEVPADSLPEETVPADQPAEQPADTQPQEPEAPAEGETGSGDTAGEAPSISLPTQEEVEQAASSIYNAASSIWGAIQDAASQQNDAA